MKKKILRIIALYTRSQLLVGALLFVSYLSVHVLVTWYTPEAAWLNPATAIALCSLYFGSKRLWPAVYIVALLSYYVSGASSFMLLTLPVIEVLQAVTGAYILKKAHIDPLFRRYRDMFIFISMVIVVSFIAPTFQVALQLLDGIAMTPLQWWQAYIATLFSFLIITPFILRWFTKQRFSRTPIEVFETAVVLLAVIAIDFLFFAKGINTFLSIPLIYFLFIPFFWIALRLRPRFVTLALLMTSIFAIISVVAGNSPFMLQELFATEVFLITLATSFFIVTSLEEDRRVNTNITRSQMGTLQNAVAKISSESRAKNDFIAILAHELRNPLAPVVSSIDLLKLKGGHSKEDNAILEVMEDRMNVVRKLLDDLLDISKITEGTIAMNRAPVNIETVVRRAIVSTEHHRKELHQRLLVKAPSKPLFVSGDVIRLEQVFSNLLTNASKYSPSGSTVVIRIKEKDGSAEIEVVDRGLGIDAQELDIIFEAFKQGASGQRSKKGLGIGLSLVRTILQMHAGTIEVKSEGQGQGSTFTVYLPLLFTHPYEEAHKETASNTTALNSAPLVLVVDDNDAAAGSIGRLLEYEGFNVVYAYDSKNALEIVSELSPSMVLLDIGLPDQDGFETAKEMRKQGFKGRLIALTGYSTDEAKGRGKDAGFEQYLVKPIGHTELKAALSKLT